MKLETGNQQRKINETKSWFFEEINKIDKNLAKLRKKKRRHKLLVQEIKRVGRGKHYRSHGYGKVKEQHEQICVHKFDNLGDMDQFFERYNLPKLIQGCINYMNRPISSNKVDPIINNIPKQKLHVQKVSLLNSTKYLRKELYQFSKISSRRQKQMEYVQTHYPNTKTRQTHYNETID